MHRGDLLLSIVLLLVGIGCFVLCSLLPAGYAAPGFFVGLVFWFFAYVSCPKIQGGFRADSQDSGAETTDPKDDH